MRGQIFFKEIITKTQNWVGSLKNLLKNHYARKAQIYSKAF
jgi:hypothetical protein